MNNVMIVVKRTALCGVLERYLLIRYRVYAEENELLELRRRIGSVYPLACELAAPVGGVLLTSEEIREALRPAVHALLCAVRHLSPASVTVMGEYVKGLQLLLEDELGIPVIFAENGCQV